MIDVVDILKKKVLRGFIGLDVYSLIQANSDFEVVINNGKESKVLVNPAYELNSHNDKIEKAKLNFTDTSYCLKSDRLYRLPKIDYNDLLTCLANEQIQYVLMSKNVNEGFSGILLANKTRIYYDLQKESIWSVECDEMY